MKYNLTNKKWSKFLNEVKLVDEISQKYIDQVKQYIKKTPPEKMSFNHIFNGKTRIAIPFSGETTGENFGPNFKRIFVLANSNDYKFDLYDP